MRSVVLALGLVALAAPQAGAQAPAPAAKATKKPKKGRKKIKETVPVDIGVGPAVHMLTGPFQEDQMLHYGLKISVQAIIPPEIIKKHHKKIPKKYRKYVSTKHEIRYSPSMFIPDTLYISPKTNNTGLYGVTLNPLTIGLTPLQTPRLSIDLGVILTYLFIDADPNGVNQKREDEFKDVPDEAFTMHFFRPGLSLSAALEVPFSDSFLVDVGWSSALYLPQEINGDFLALGDIKDSIWHIGQAWLRFHFRFPYEASI
ncbi:hypothetical protein KJ940_12745 [Myxococcota bacterium]|nr:hypothetical protein [Myxococcota bacterium]